MMAARVAHKLQLPAVCLTLLVFIITGATAWASDAYPFREGSTRFSLLIGSGSAFDRNYTVFGLGLGYYLIDGLEAGLEAETWQGSDPGISRVTPGFRYVFYSAGAVKPYAGAFYRRTSIQGYQDQNDAGVRAGGIVAAGRRAYLGAGAVYAAHINCDRTVYSSCSEIYPELQFAVIF
jgi:hypothetical protein